MVKHHTREFIRCMQGLPVARDEFNRFLTQDARYLTDIQRAVRWFYLIRNSYGSKIVNPTITISNSRAGRLNALTLKRDIFSAQRRLARVSLENLSFRDFIPRMDAVDTFFYVDPPYFACEDYYGKNIFSREDFTVLRDMLAQIHGKFCLSINDVPEIRELFKPFNIKEVKTRYSMAGGNRSKKVQELLVMNY